MVKENKTLYPSYIRLLGAIAIMLESEFVSNLVQKLWLVHHASESNEACYNES